MKEKKVEDDIVLFNKEIHTSLQAILLDSIDSLEGVIGNLDKEIEDLTTRRNLHNNRLLMEKSILEKLSTGKIHMDFNIISKYSVPECRFVDPYDEEYFFYDKRNMQAFEHLASSLIERLGGLDRKAKEVK